MKLAIVTGAASGIGLEIALKLKSQNYQVVCLDLKSPPSDSEIHFYECDISNEEIVSKTYQRIKEKFGPCSVLINNSGLQFMSPIEEFPLEKWKLLIDVLLTGTFICSKTVIPDMKQQNWGRIINISSIHGKEASPFKSAYVAAKHGVLGLSKVMALELAPSHITVNSICPGFVDTPLMLDQVKSQMLLNKMNEDEVLSNIFLKNQCIKKLTHPSQIAALVSFLLSEDADTITGEAFNISGGWGMGR